MFGNIKSLIQLVKDRSYSKKEIAKGDSPFGEVSSFCMFIGYPRSSHSLMGSLIDAHPNAIIAHEQDMLKHIRYGFSKEAIFHLLLKNSRDFTENGRSWTGYSYEVPGQYQGRYTTLKLIGDKRGANSARRFRKYPDILEKLQHELQLPIKMIHVIRNPFDNISTMAYRNNGSVKSRVTKALLDAEITNYFSLVKSVYDVQNQIGREHVIDIQIEQFMKMPKEELTRLCQFLGLEIIDNYIEACAAIVYSNPHRTREEYPWDAELIARVDSEMRRYPFYEGYSFTV